MPKKTFYVYILRCGDGSYYSGYTTDLESRVAEHNGLSKKPGAKYTRSRRPVTLVYQEEYPTKSDAMKREYELKQLSHAQKDKLISDKSNCLV